jgi:hypothetical protein
MGNGRQFNDGIAAGVELTKDAAASAPPIDK